MLTIFSLVNEFLGLEPLETGVSLDILDATIISSNFWPPIQVSRTSLTFSAMSYCNF